MLRASAVAPNCPAGRRPCGRTARGCSDLAHGPVGCGGGEHLGTVRIFAVRYICMHAGDCMRTHFCR